MKSPASSISSKTHPLRNEFPAPEAALPHARLSRSIADPSPRSTLGIAAALRLCRYRHAHPTTGVGQQEDAACAVATARTGQWLLIDPRVVKTGSTLGFVDALVGADGAIIARAAATFRMLA